MTPSCLFPSHRDVGGSPERWIVELLLPTSVLGAHTMFSEEYEIALQNLKLALSQIDDYGSALASITESQPTQEWTDSIRDDLVGIQQSLQQAFPSLKRVRREVFALKSE